MTNTTTENLTPEEYAQAFEGKEIDAFQQAIDIRKFEIELYWKRATYFWTFIGATFAAFLAVQASTSETRTDLSVFLSCIGLVFSFGWVCVNKGSKYWQENWEKHVDLLEDQITGPLYKIELTRNDEMSRFERVSNFATGPAQISVSKVNILISIYVSVLWVFLLCYSLPEFNSSATVSWYHVFSIVLSISACISFIWQGKSYKDGLYHIAKRRQSRIKPAHRSNPPIVEASAD